MKKTIVDNIYLYKIINTFKASAKTSNDLQTDVKLSTSSTLVLDV